MTIARDIHTNAVIGQTCDLRHFTDSTRYALTEDDVFNSPFLYLLGRNGKYVRVRRSDVLLEDVSDD